MALTLGNPTFVATSTRDAQANAFAAQVDAQASQVIVLMQTSGSIDLVSFTLDGTNAFGAGGSSTGTLTLDVSPAISGTAGAGSATAVNQWELRAPTGTPLLRGPVTGSDTITSGQTVNLTSFTLTWPAS